jgi:hypothetical protein
MYRILKKQFEILGQSTVTNDTYWLKEDACLSWIVGFLWDVKLKFLFYIQMNNELMGDLKKSKLNSI